jgi:hypothetical protein
VRASVHNVGRFCYAVDGDASPCVGNSEKTGAGTTRQGLDKFQHSSGRQKAETAVEHVPSSAASCAGQSLTQHVHARAITQG